MEPSLATLLLVTVGVIAVLGLILAMTAPVSVLAGDSQWEIVSAFHGMTATAFLLGATVAVYLSWRLYIGEIRAFKDLHWLTAISTVASIATIAFGNWIYIAYRAPGGPRSYFVSNLPEVHAIFFEFKEFIALFTLPMFAFSTFVLWRYGEGISKNPRARAAASVPVLLGWTFLLIAYVLGAAITKLRGV
jgi:hypothetical protein